MKVSKVLATVVFLVVVSGIVYAAWSAYISPQAVTGAVTSTADTPLTVSVPFSDFGCDAQAGACAGGSLLVIANDNGELNLTLTIDESLKDDETDSCTDYLNDCTIEYHFNGASVNDGDLVTLNSGDNTAAVNLSCVKLSCPQQWAVNLSLA